MFYSAFFPEFCIWWSANEGGYSPRSPWLRYWTKVLLYKYYFLLCLQNFFVIYAVTVSYCVHLYSWIYFQVLKFFAYFKETVHESQQEYYRVRPVEIFYYLEDDSISVMEPHVENAGMPQVFFAFTTLQLFHFAAVTFLHCFKELVEFLCHSFSFER